MPQTQRRWQLVYGLFVAIGIALIAACTSGGSSSASRVSPAAPSAATAGNAALNAADAADAGAAGTAGATADRGTAAPGTPRTITAPGEFGGISPLDVAFPPRDQALRFRQELEAYYRDVFRRPATSSFVDIEGTIVWTQEYLRYRVNGCNHDTAVARVLAQIDNPAASTAACSTTETPFPPRNEPFQFRQALEAKYRDGLRRPAGTTFVDPEGDIVWTQEYLRYRTTACSDAQASERVRTQLQGGAPPAGCSTTSTSTTSTTSTTTTVPGGGGGGGGASPAATFSVSPEPCQLSLGPVGARLNCTFDSTGSTASSGGTLASFSWSVGGRSFTGPSITSPEIPCGNPTGFFTLPVSLTVTDSFGRSASTSRSVRFERNQGC